MAKVDLSRQKFTSVLDRCTEIVKTNWKLIGGIWLVYVLVYFILAGGASVDVDKLRADLDSNLSIESSSAVGQLVVASAVLQASSSLNQGGTGAMLFVMIFTVLALIWALRLIWTKKSSSIRDTFYKSPQAAVKLSILLLGALVQLLPLAVGWFILSTALSQEVFVTNFEIFGAAILLGVLPAIWSFTMLLNMLFALIIVTIPDMMPLKAYQEAKALIKGHRAYLVRQLLCLILLWLIFAAAIMLMIIAVAPVAAPMIGFLLTTTILPIMTIFTYTLYRNII